MILKIANPRDFELQLKNIFNRNAAKILDNFSGQIKGHLNGQLQQFRGKKVNSIADPRSTVSTLRRKELVLTVNPDPLTVNVFRMNALPQSGKQLFRGEAPEWFDYHELKSDSVIVRPTGASGSGLRPPLGDQERHFYENTFNYLVRNAQKIINDVW